MLCDEECESLHAAEAKKQTQMRKHRNKKKHITTTNNSSNGNSNNLDDRNQFNGLDNNNLWEQIPTVDS